MKIDTTRQKPEPLISALAIAELIVFYRLLFTIRQQFQLYSRLFHARLMKRQDSSMIERVVKRCLPGEQL